MADFIPSAAVGGATGMAVDPWARQRHSPSERMESIAFARAMDVRWHEARDGVVSLQLPFSPAVSVAGPGTPIDPGALLALFDHACGGAVHGLLGPGSPTATLDLRVDYFRPPPPDTDAVVRCRCVSADSASVTVQGFSTFGNDGEPTAMVVGRFIVGADPGRTKQGGDGFPTPVVAPPGMVEAVDAERAQLLTFRQTLGAEVSDPWAEFAALPRLVGAPMLPALHGGAVASLMMAATDARVAAAVGPSQGLSSITVRYLRASRLAATRALASIDKQGSSATFASAVVTQDDGARITATAQMIYLAGQGTR